MKSATLLEARPSGPKLIYQKLAGALLFIGATQFIVGMFLAEATYPGYSISENFISDLGVGPSASVFNSSVFLLGLTAVVAAYLLQRAFGQLVVSVFFALAGAGAMGVGIFPESFGTGLVHTLASLVAFLFGGLAAIIAYKLEKPPLTYLSVVMGVIALLALGLFLGNYFLSLGKGGMERMIAYPILLWVVGFGGYLMTLSLEKS